MSLLSSFSFLFFYFVFCLILHECFEFGRMIRDALVAKEAATILRNQHVVLDADAAEVLVGLQQVEVQELLAMTLGTSLVDEGMNEIDAGLVSHHKALFQLSAHAQAVGAELLQIGTCLVVETHVNLS